MATQQVAPVTCPNCSTRFNAPVQSIINGQDPTLKSAFLQGRLNIVQCPQCGMTSPLGLPILYYDLEKELAFVFLPNGLQITNAEQEKIIGELTNTLTNQLQPEQRKFYLLNPKPFLSLDSLVKEILKADGITEEMFEAQRSKVQLLEELLKIEDEEQLKAKIKENDDKLDRQFFEIVTATIQGAQMEGNEAGAQAIFGLRAFLAQHSSQGQQAVADIDAELGVLYIQSPEQLLEMLQNAANDEEFEQLIAAGHQYLDYQFFQTLTAQIDDAAKKGDNKKSMRLKDLRSKILETKGRLEEESRAAVEKSVALIREILEADDPQKAVKAKLDQMDHTFFAVLAANIDGARQHKQEELAKAMEMLGSMAMTMLQEKMGGGSQTKQPQASPSPIHLP
ncbi:MAG: CpXC domain-containing protein [Anaerolineae bacterium]|nr:CpXC domain-containing protein [Anaerolineae bacterium]